MSTSSSPRPAALPLARIETQYRRALIRRWFDFTWRAAFFAGIVTAISTFAITREGSSLVYGFLGGLAAFPVVLYPLLSNRRLQITNPPKSTASTSFLTAFTSTVTSARPLRLLSSYVLLAGTFSLLFTQVISLTNSSPDLGLFKTTARHPLHLNERVAFLFWGNIQFFFLLGIADLLRARFESTWPRRRTPLFIAAQKSLNEGILSLLEVIPIHGWFSFLFVAFTPIYSVLYWYFRRRVWLSLARWWLAPFVINWARLSKTNLSTGLITYLYVLIFSSMVLLRLPTAILNVYVTQPLNFDALTRKSPLGPDRYLLTALKSGNAYQVHFTLMELLRVSHDKSRRAGIFIADADKSGKQLVYVLELWQALLLNFGRSYQTLSTRGGSRPLTTARPAPPSAPDPRAIKVQQADVFRPINKPKSAIEAALQSTLDGPVRPTPPAVVNAEKVVLNVESKALKQVEGVAQQALKRIEGVPVGEAVLAETKGLVQGVYQWYGRDWAKRSVGTSVPDPSVTNWTMEIFTALSVASAEEDKYGFVQSVLPATLEAIVRYRSALLNLESELLIGCQTLGRGGEAAAGEVKRLIGDHIQACDRSVLRVGERFGKSLSAFRFSPGIAAQLTDICRPLETIQDD